MEEHASIAAATAGPLAASPPAESAAPTSPRPEDLQSAASQLEALPCVPAVGTSLAAVIEPANNRSDVELVGSPPSRKRGRSSAPRELIVISSDSDSGGEDASLEALIQSRKARKFPRAGQSPAPYAVSAVDDGILEQLAQKRREKKQRRWLRKQARVAAAAPRGGQRSLSEEREPRPARTRPAPAWTPAGRHAHKQWARAVMPRRIHPMVCENGTVFPISLLNPSVDGVSHLIMLDLDNWPGPLRSAPSLHSALVSAGRTLGCSSPAVRPLSAVLSLLPPPAAGAERRRARVRVRRRAYHSQGAERRHGHPAASRTARPFGRRRPPRIVCSLTPVFLLPHPFAVPSFGFGSAPVIALRASDRSATRDADRMRCDRQRL